MSNVVPAERVVDEPKRVIIDKVHTKRLTDEHIRKRSPFPMAVDVYSARGFTRDFKDVRLQSQRIHDTLYPLRYMTSELQPHIESPVPEIPAGCLKLVHSLLSVTCPHCSKDRTITNARNMEVDVSLGLYPELPWKSELNAHHLSLLEEAYEILRPYERYPNEPEYFYPLPRPLRFRYRTIQLAVKRELSLNMEIVYFRALKMIEWFTFPKLPRKGIFMVDEDVILPEAQKYNYYRHFFAQRPVLTKLLHQLRHAFGMLQYQLPSDGFLIVDKLSLVAMLRTGDPTFPRARRNDTARTRNTILDAKQTVYRRRMAVTRILLEHIDHIGMTCFANVLHRRNLAESLVHEVQSDVAALQCEPALAEEDFVNREDPQRDHEAKRHAYVQESIRVLQSILVSDEPYLKQTGLRRAHQNMQLVLNALEHARDTVVTERVHKGPDVVDPNGRVVFAGAEKLAVYRAKYALGTAVRVRNTQTSTMRTTEWPVLIATHEKVRVGSLQTPGRGRVTYCSLALGGCGMHALPVHNDACDIYYQHYPGTQLRMDHVIPLGGLAPYSTPATFSKSEITRMGTPRLDFPLAATVPPSWDVHSGEASFQHLPTYPHVDEWIGKLLDNTVHMPPGTRNWYVTPFDLKGILRRVPHAQVNHWFGHSVDLDSLFPMTRLVSRASWFTNVSYSVSGDDSQETDRREVKDTILTSYELLLLSNHELRLAHRSACERQRYLPLSTILTDPCPPKRFGNIFKTANASQNYRACTVMKGSYLSRRNLWGIPIPNGTLKSHCERTHSYGSRLETRAGVMRAEAYPYVHNAGRSGVVCASEESFPFIMVGREIERKLTRTEPVLCERDVNYMRAFADYVQFKRMSVTRRQTRAMRLHATGILPYSKTNTDSSEDVTYRDVYPIVLFVCRKSGTLINFDDLDSRYAEVRAKVRAYSKEAQVDVARPATGTKGSLYEEFDASHVLEQHRYHPQPAYSSFLYSSHIALGDEVELTVTIPYHTYVDMFVPVDIKKRHGVPLRGPHSHFPHLLAACRAVTRVGHVLFERQPVQESPSLTQGLTLPGALHHATLFPDVCEPKHDMDNDGDHMSIKAVRDGAAGKECTERIGAVAFLASPLSGNSRVVMHQCTVTTPSAWSRSSMPFSLAQLVRLIQSTQKFREWSSKRIVEELNRRIQLCAIQLNTEGEDTSDLTDKYWQYRHFLLFVLPEKMNYTRGTPAKPLKYIRIRCGWILEGILNKEDLGQSECSILNHLVRSGPDGLSVATDFIDNMRFSTYALCKMHPYSMTGYDLQVNAEVFEAVHAAMDGMRQEERMEYLQFRKSKKDTLTRVAHATLVEDLMLGFLFHVKWIGTVRALEREETSLATNQVVRRGERCETVFAETTFAHCPVQYKACPPVEGRRYMFMYESGGKSSMLDHRFMSTAIGPQLPYSKCVDLLDNHRRLTPFATQPWSAEDRNFVSSSFTAGLSPLEQFQNSMLSRPSVADSSRVTTTGTNTRTWNTTMGATVVATDLTLLHGGDQILSFCAGGDGGNGLADEVVTISITKYLEKHAPGVVLRAIQEGVYLGTMKSAGYKRHFGRFACMIMNVCTPRNKRTVQLLDSGYKALHYSLVLCEARSLTYAGIVARVRSALVPRFLSIGIPRYRADYQRHDGVHCKQSLWPWLRTALRTSLTTCTTLARIAICKHAHSMILPNPLDTSIRLPMRMNRLVKRAQWEYLPTAEVEEPLSEVHVHEGLLALAHRINSHNNWLFTENIAPAHRQDTIFWYVYSALTYRRVSRRFGIRTLPMWNFLVELIFQAYVDTRVKVGSNLGCGCLQIIRAIFLQQQLQSKNSTTRVVNNTKGQRRCDNITSCQTDVPDMLSEVSFESTVPENTGYATVKDLSSDKALDSLFVRRDFMPLVKNVSETEDAEKVMEILLETCKGSFALHHEDVSVTVYEKHMSRAAGVVELDMQGIDRVEIRKLLELFRGALPTSLTMAVIMDPNRSRVFIFVRAIVQGLSDPEMEQKIVVNRLATSNSQTDTQARGRGGSVESRSQSHMKRLVQWALRTGTTVAVTPAPVQPAISFNAGNSVEERMDQALRSAAQLLVDSMPAEVSESVSLVTMQQQQQQQQVQNSVTAEAHDAAMASEKKKKRKRQTRIVVNQEEGLLVKPKKKSKVSTTAAAAAAAKMPPWKPFTYYSTAGYLMRLSVAVCASMLPDTGFNRVHRVPEKPTVRFLMGPSHFSVATVLVQASRSDVIPGSAYCTEPSVMEMMCGCSAAEVAMNHEIMKSLEGNKYIHPRVTGYPAAWLCATGRLRPISKTTHAATAEGFIDRAMFNDSAHTLFHAGVGGTDRLEGISSIFFGVGPKSGGNFTDRFVVPPERLEEEAKRPHDATDLDDIFAMKDEERDDEKHEAVDFGVKGRDLSVATTTLSSSSSSSVSHGLKPAKRNLKRPWCDICETHDDMCRTDIRGISMTIEQYGLNAVGSTFSYSVKDI